MQDGVGGVRVCVCAREGGFLSASNYAFPMGGSGRACDKGAGELDKRAGAVSGGAGTGAVSGAMHV